MMRVSPTLRLQCLDALALAAEEIAATSFGGLPVEATTTSPDPSDCCAALVSLVVDEHPAHVGLLLPQPATQPLAKLFLGAAVEDEDFPEADVADALCELANLLAGGMKRRLVDRAAIKVGLPLFAAAARSPDGVAQSRRSLRFGDAAIDVVLLTSDTPPRD